MGSCLSGPTELTEKQQLEQKKQELLNELKESKLSKQNPFCGSHMFHEQTSTVNWVAVLLKINEDNTVDIKIEMGDPGSCGVDELQGKWKFVNDNDQNSIIITAEYEYAWIKQLLFEINPIGNIYCTNHDIQKTIFEGDSKFCRACDKCGGYIFHEHINHFGHIPCGCDERRHLQREIIEEIHKNAITC